MKFTTTLISGAAIFCTAQLAIASVDQAQLPNLPAYIANAPPKPPVREQIHQHLSYLKNFYVTGSIGGGYGSLSKIDARDSNIKFNPIKSNESSIVPSFSFGMGYHIWDKWFFSRIAVEYTYTPNMGYDASPFLNSSNGPLKPSEISAKTSSNLLLLKVYNDFKIQKRWYPYIDGGAGIAVNSTSANGNVLSNPFDNTKTNTDFAWTVGTGFNININHHLLAGLGYSFISAGKAEYEINAPPFLNFSLEAQHIYLNTIDLHLIFKPVTETDDD